MDQSEKPPVLLVDDNEPTCTLMTALLRKDFVVDIAIDGMEAIDKLRTNSYGAIILDLLMPHLDGYGVLDFLKDNNPPLLRRVLVVTAALSATEVRRVHDYEVCALISKPFEVETLLNAVKQCTDETSSSRGTFLSSGVILLLADLLRQRWM
jgi:putative two-component system response regulator